MIRMITTILLLTLSTAAHAVTLTQQPSVPLPLVSTDAMAAGRSGSATAYKMTLGQIDGYVRGSTVNLTGDQTVGGNKTFTTGIQTADLLMTGVLGPWVDDRAYTTLAAADTAAAAAGKLLVIGKVWTTVPATLTAAVRVLPGGQLNGSASVVIGGAFEGSDGCFGASQAVVFRQGAITQKSWFASSDEYATGHQDSGQKAWRQTYGTKDTAATVSVTAGGGATEPETQVLGFDDPSDASVYSNRDSVAMFVQNLAQPILLSTANTTFTTTSVTSADFSSVASQLKTGMLIDVVGSPTITGTITSIIGSTVNVSNWYKVDGTRDTTTPADGATIKVNPATKVWAHNANVEIPTAAYASSATGFELGTLLTKTGSGALSYGFDTVWLGGEKAKAAYAARNGFTRGFYSDSATTYGLYTEKSSEMNALSYQDGSLTGSRIGFYSAKFPGASLGAKVGFKSGGDVIGMQISDASTAAFKVTVGGVDKLIVNSSGQIADFFLRPTVVSTTTTITAGNVVLLVNTSGITVTLPTATGNSGKIFIIRSSAPAGFTLAATGSTIESAATLAVADGDRLMLVSDGSGWLRIL